MPDVNITIGTPVLVSGEHFKVRYRLLPGGSFSTPQNETNAQFTFTGLSAGSYELEVILVKADGSECPATYQIFEVVTPFTCIDFTASIVAQDNGLFYLTIVYTPGANPACGWDIVYNGNTVHYATLPASPIKIPVPNTTTSLQIVADSCNGNRKACFDDDIPPVEVTCTPMTTVFGTVLINPLSTQTNPNFSIFVHYNQSIPCTTSTSIQCQQINVLAGTPATVSFSPVTILCGGSPAAALSFGFGIAPNPNVQWVSAGGGEKRRYQFVGTITDVCGKVHAWSCSIDY